jgi:tRNA threonylcarbamoyl adenosine modification protein (Sua5/YciO/YrdC/YwlC family)
MSEVYQLHPHTPEVRWLKRAADVLRSGGVIVYPTDSCYALGAGIEHKAAMDVIAQIRDIDKHHHFTLVCRDLSEISRYAKVGNSQYRLLKAATPGPYTFILEATREVPRRLSHHKRRTVGVRIPDHPVVHGLLTELAHPLMSSTLILPSMAYPLNDPDEITKKLSHLVDLILLQGPCGIEPTTVIDLAHAAPLVVREGKGDVAVLGTRR